MAFNINAQVILSGPKNIKAITKTIKTELASVSAPVNLTISKGALKHISSLNQNLSSLVTTLDTLKSGAGATASKGVDRLTKSLSTTGKSATKSAKSYDKVAESASRVRKEFSAAGNEVQAFGKDAALAVRRFTAFTLATGAVFGFVRAVQSATSEALKFQREIVKVVQVTGDSGKRIDSLTASINSLSVSLGVDANELAKISRIFAQTGQSLDQVEDSLRAVARSTLTPSFGTMEDTTEGLIAAMAQFNIEANRAENVLGALNAVAKKFAVESQDLISVVRRAGGIFAQAAGDVDKPIDALNQLIGIFTAVRSTTRESADTIAVGLRTIFTRIQRRGTIDFLKQFNIELVDVKGNFVGLFPAFEELSKGLDSIIKRGDALALSTIAEELGGIRQVGKLIPAIANFNKALAATKIAGEGAAKGLGKDVTLALQPLGKQFEQLQTRFSALVRSIADSKTFQGLAKVALSIANAFLSVAETLKPLLPLMATFAAVKISKGIFEFGRGFIGGLKKGGGAPAVGETLAGAVTGGGGDRAKVETDKKTKALATNQALTSAIKLNIGALNSNTINLGMLSDVVMDNSRQLVLFATGLSSAKPIGGGGGLRSGGRIRRVSGGRVGYNDGGPVLIEAPANSSDAVKRVAQKANTGLYKQFGVVGLRGPKGQRDARDESIPAMKIKAVAMQGIPEIQVTGGGTAPTSSKLEKMQIAEVAKGGGESRTKLKGGSANIFKDLMQGIQDVETEVYSGGAGDSGLWKTMAKDIAEYSAILGQQFVDEVAGNYGVKSDAIAGKIESGFLKDNMSNFSQIAGNVFEAALSEAGGVFGDDDDYTVGKANRAFDFPTGVAAKAAEFFGIPSGIPTDAKSTTAGQEISMTGKITSYYADAIRQAIKTQRVEEELGKGEEGMLAGIGGPEGFLAEKIATKTISGSGTIETGDVLREIFQIGRDTSDGAVDVKKNQRTEWAQREGRFHKGQSLLEQLAGIPGIVGRAGGHPQFEDLVFDKDYGTTLPDAEEAPELYLAAREKIRGIPFGSTAEEDLRSPVLKGVRLYQQRRDGGAGIGVPAMVTAGEAFVSPKGVASAGVGNLEQANKTGSMAPGAFSSLQSSDVSIFSGPGGIDNIPADLPAGGYVIRKDSTQSLFGSKRGGRVAFAKGGLVGGGSVAPAGGQPSPKDKRAYLRMQVNEIDQGEGRKDSAAEFYGTPNAPHEEARDKKILTIHGVTKENMGGTGRGGYQIKWNRGLPASLKGEGYGTSAMWHLWNWIQSQQLDMYSDEDVSADAVSSWLRMKKFYGVPVRIKEIDRENAQEWLMSGGWQETSTGRFRHGFTSEKQGTPFLTALSGTSLSAEQQEQLRGMSIIDIAGLGFKDGGRPRRSWTGESEDPDIEQEVKASTGFGLGRSGTGRMSLMGGDPKLAQLTDWHIGIAREILGRNPELTRSQAQSERFIDKVRKWTRKRMKDKDYNIEAAESFAPMEYQMTSMDVNNLLERQSGENLEFIGLVKHNEDVYTERRRDLDRLTSQQSREEYVSGLVNAVQQDVLIARNIAGSPTPQQAFGPKTKKSPHGAMSEDEFGRPIAEPKGRLVKLFSGFGGGRADRFEQSLGLPLGGLMNRANWPALVGQVLKVPGYLSTSSQIATAASYATATASDDYGDNSTGVLSINTKRGYKAMDMRRKFFADDPFTGENEVVLPKNTRLEITDIQSLKDYAGIGGEESRHGVPLGEVSIPNLFVQQLKEGGKTKRRKTGLMTRASSYRLRGQAPFREILPAEDLEGVSRTHRAVGLPSPLKKLQKHYGVDTREETIAAYERKIDEGLKSGTLRTTNTGAIMRVEKEFWGPVLGGMIPWENEETGQAYHYGDITNAMAAAGLEFGMEAAMLPGAIVGPIAGGAAGLAIDLSLFGIENAVKAGAWLAKKGIEVTAWGLKKVWENRKTIAESIYNNIILPAADHADDYLMPLDTGLHDGGRIGFAAGGMSTAEALRAHRKRMGRPTISDKRIAARTAERKRDASTVGIEPLPVEPSVEEEIGLKPLPSDILAEGMRRVEAERLAAAETGFVDKRPFINMVTTGNPADYLTADFIGKDDAPDPSARGKSIFTIDGYSQGPDETAYPGFRVSDTSEIKDPLLRGKGYGSAGYALLAQKVGKPLGGFYSDGIVSASASLVWSKLAKHYPDVFTNGISLLTPDEFLTGAGKRKGKGITQAEQWAKILERKKAGESMDETALQMAGFTKRGKMISQTGAPVWGGALRKGGLVGFAKGGAVPGSGNRDSVPALLTPGEFVMNKSASGNIGYSNLKRMNKGGRVGRKRYAGGGSVSGSIPPELSGEAFLDALMAAYREGELAVDSFGSDLAEMVDRGDFGKDWDLGIDDIIADALGTSGTGTTGPAEGPVVDASISLTKEFKGLIQTIQGNIKTIDGWATAVEQGAVSAEDASAAISALARENAGAEDAITTLALKTREIAQIEQGLDPGGMFPPMMTPDLELADMVEAAVGRKGTAESPGVGADLDFLEEIGDRINFDAFQTAMVEAAGEVAAGLPDTRGMAEQFTTVVQEFERLKSEGKDVGDMLDFVRSKGFAAGDEFVKMGAKSLTTEQLIGGLGNAAGAVTGIVTAVATFDVENPIASLAGLAFAIKETTSAIGIFAPELVKNMVKGFKGSNIGKTLASQLDSIKGAPKRLGDAFSVATRDFKAAKGAGKGLGNTFKALKTGAGGFAKNLGGASKVFGKGGALVKIMKGAFTGLPGLIASFIAAPLVNAIAQPIVKGIFGAKKTIEGTDIEGRSAGGSGHVAGALEGSGLAVSAGIAAASLLSLAGATMPWVIAIGVAIAAFKLFESAMVGAAKQLEFAEHTELRKQIKNTTESLVRLNKTQGVNADELGSVNQRLGKSLGQIDKAQGASFARERTEQAFSVSGLFGEKGAIEEFAGGGTTGDVVGAGAATAAGAATGAAVGAALGTLGGPLAPLTSTVGAVIGAIVGGIAGLVTSLASADQQLIATSKAFDKAAMAITPEFLEQLNAAADKLAGQVAKEYNAANASIMKEITGLKTFDLGIDTVANDTKLTNESFSRMTELLKGADEQTRKFAEELNRFTSLKIEFALIDDIKREAELLDEEGAGALKLAFSKVRGNLDRELLKTDPGKAWEKALEGLDNDKTPLHLKADMEKLITARKAEAVELQKAKELERQIAAAAAEAAKHLDALAAALQNVSAQTTGVAAQFRNFTDNFKTDFENAFSDRVAIGNVSQLNPFENVEAATLDELDLGMDQVRGLRNIGGRAAGGGDPFTGIPDLVKSQKQLPFIVKESLKGLETRRASGEEITNVEVSEAIRDNLAKSGIELPEAALRGLEEKIRGAALRQGEKQVFSAGALEDLLKSGGEVSSTLVDMGQKGQDAMKTLFDASQSFKQSIINVSQLQQDLIEKRRDMELSVLDKEMAIRDKVNKAVGRAPDAMDKAVGELGSRLKTLSGPVAGTGVGGPANAFDPQSLLDTRKRLLGRQAKIRERLGIGSGQAGGEAADLTATEQKGLADKLGKVNAQLNGTTAALKELSNDTRLLAAIEEKIHAANEKERSAKSGISSVVEAFSKVRKGEMSMADFNKQFQKPLQTLNKIRGGKDIGFDEGVDILKRIESNDPLIRGSLEQLAEERQASGIDTRPIAEQINDLEIGLLKKLGTAAAKGLDAAGAGPGGAGGFVRGQVTRLVAARKDKQSLAGDAKAVGDLQTEAMRGLFDQQAQQTNKIFDEAGKKLGSAAERFQKAVDDFALLRGTTNVADAAQRVQAAKTALAEAEKGGDTRKIKNAKLNLAQAEDMQSQAMSNQASDRQRIERDREAQAARNLSVDKQLEADAETKKVQAGMRGEGTGGFAQFKTKERARIDRVHARDMGADAGPAELESGLEIEGLRSDDTLADATRKLQKSAESQMGVNQFEEFIAGFSEITGGGVSQDRINETLGQGGWSNQEFSQLTSEQKKDMDNLFKDVAEQALGKGTQAAASLAAELKRVAADTSRLGEDGDHFGEVAAATIVSFLENLEKAGLNPKEVEALHQKQAAGGKKLANLKGKQQQLMIDQQTERELPNSPVGDPLSRTGATGFMGAQISKTQAGKFTLDQTGTDEEQYAREQAFHKLSDKQKEQILAQQQQSQSGGGRLTDDQRTEALLAAVGPEPLSPSSLSGIGMPSPETVESQLKEIDARTSTSAVQQVVARGRTMQQGPPRSSITPRRRRNVPSVAAGTSSARGLPTAGTQAADRARNQAAAEAEVADLEASTTTISAGALTTQKLPEEFQVGTSAGLRPDPRGNVTGRARAFQQTSRQGGRARRIGADIQRSRDQRTPGQQQTQAQSNLRRVGDRGGLTQADMDRALSTDPETAFNTELGLPAPAARAAAKPPTRRAKPNEGAAPGGPEAVGGNIIEAFTNGSELLKQNLTDAFTEGAQLVKDGMIEALKTIPNQIVLTGQIGKVEVELTGGAALKGIQDAMLNTLRQELGITVGRVFNSTDGSVSDPSNSASAPNFNNNGGMGMMGP